MQYLNADTNRCLLRKMCPALRKLPAILRPQFRNCDTCSMNLTNFLHHWMLNRHKMAFPEAVPYLVLLSSTDYLLDDLLNQKYLRKLFNYLDNYRLLIKGNIFTNYYFSFLQLKILSSIQKDHYHYRKTKMILFCESMLVWMLLDFYIRCLSLILH